jgi:hypothetical protein
VPFGFAGNGREGADIGKAGDAVEASGAEVEFG